MSCERIGVVVGCKIGVFLNCKGQISQEMIAALAVIFIFFIIITTYTTFLNNTNLEIGEQLGDRQACTKISSTISSLYSMQHNSEISFFVDRDFNISSNIISVGRYWCGYSGPETIAYLSKGDIKITIQNGGLFVENT